MKLTVLGSGTAVPVAGRAPAGYLIEEEGEAVVMELGAGTLMRVVESGVPFAAISLILITHLHLDHCADLAPLLFALNNPANPREQPLPLVGPPGLLDHCRGLEAVYGRWCAAQPDRVTLQEVDPSQPPLSMGDPPPNWNVQWRPVQHTPGSMGFRLCAPSGAIIAYSGDSGPCEALVTLGRDADLLILELSATDQAPIPNHLTPTEAAKVAAQAKPNRVLLTHFYPAVPVDDAVRAVAHYSGVPAIAAADGSTYEIAKSSKDEILYPSNPLK